MLNFKSIQLWISTICLALWNIFYSPIKMLLLYIVNQWTHCIRNKVDLGSCQKIVTFLVT